MGDNTKFRTAREWRGLDLCLNETPGRMGPKAVVSFFALRPLEPTSPNPLDKTFSLNEMLLSTHHGRHLSWRPPNLGPWQHLSQERDGSKRKGAAGAALWASHTLPPRDQMHMD